MEQAADPHFLKLYMLTNSLTPLAMAEKEGHGERASFRGWFVAERRPTVLERRDANQRQVQLFEARRSSFLYPSNLCLCHDPYPVCRLCPVPSGSIKAPKYLGTS